MSMPAHALDSVSSNNIVLNMGFESVMTNTSPSGISLANTYAYVRADEFATNKTLEVAKVAKTGSIGFTLGGQGDSMNFSFDLLMKDMLVSRSFGVKDGSGLAGTVATIGTDGTVRSNDGRSIWHLECDKWYNISFVTRFGDNRAILYIDGRCIASNILLESTGKFGTASSLMISMGSGGFGSFFYLDNVRAAKGTEFLKDSAYPSEEYNYGEEPYTSAVDESNHDSKTVYVNTDFNSDTTGKKPATGNGDAKEDGNVFRVEEVPDASNKSFMFKKGGGSDPLYNFNISGFKALYAVLELSFMSVDTASSKVITMRDVNAQFNEVFRVAPGGKIKVAGNDIGEYEPGKWYDVRLILNYRDFTIDAYIGNELVSEDIPFKNSSADSPATMRLTMPVSSEPGTVYIDYIRFYAGKEFRELTVSASGSSGKKQLIRAQSEIEALLKNTVAMQSYGTAVYANGTKSQLTKAAVIDGGKVYVPLRYAVESFGGTVTWDNATMSASALLNDSAAVFTVGSPIANINGTQVQMPYDAVTHDGTLVVPADVLCQSLLDAKLSYDDKYGVVVIDCDKKELAKKDLKAIYDFITYTRPTAAQILADFEKNKNVHPRIIADEATFQRVKYLYDNNDTIKQWCDNIFKSCNKTITSRHTYYYIPDGMRLLNMARQLLSRSYNLSFAYRMTGEQKYLDYLWGEIEAVCTFSDWNAHRHFLDTAEMTVGVAIAYDWLYDTWTPEQRQLMEDAMLNMGLKQGELFYKWEMPSGTQWQTITNNWSIVCNGGMTVGALALMDKYPEYSAQIIETAFHSLENALGEFSPDGAWVEGPDYWTYTNQYLGYYMSSLLKSLGTDYGYLSTNNIVKTGEYATYTQSHQGAFNIGDAGAGKVGSSTVFFYSDYFKKPELTRLRLIDMENYKTSAGVMDIIYINPDMMDANAHLSLDYMMREVEIATFRSAWNDNTAIFAGIKGGYNDDTHGNLDAGTFILDAMGVRWADELGSDDYNQANYFEKSNAARYYLYYCSTQGQNVLAINPISELGQQQYSTSEITEFVSKPKGGYSVIDMTSAYGNKVTSARRGLKFDHNRTQVVIQDELSLKNATDVWWFMQTKASVEIIKNGRAALLTKNGRTMYVGLDTNIKGAKFTTSKSAPLSGSPIKPGVNSTASFTRLQIHLPNAKGEARLAVRFIPITGQMMYQDILNNGISKLEPISMWHIEDGEIVRPVASSITVDGKELQEFDPLKNAYNIDLDFGQEKAPFVEAQSSDDYIVEVSQPQDANGTAEIKVTEKADENNISYYSLSFKVQPLMGLPEGYNKFEVKNVSVSSQPQEQNPKEAAIDGNINTRWSAEGENEWIAVDLGSKQTISTITLSFYQGTKRVTYFDIEVSADGTNYTKVFSGESSGLTDDYETYFVGEHTVRYIRINSRGNSANKWNSFNEIQIYGK